VTVPGGDQHLGILPRRLHRHCGASAVAALAVINRMEDSVKLTDTQLVLLSAASQRDDRALERPANLTGGAAAILASAAGRRGGEGARWEPNRPSTYVL
jgi:hypothetical protein